ncbi:hypothetical protein [Pseudoalteromonas sp. OOF1S-7]|uniref:hypothetical protein n=1 Tax=Pseudoalteromonas sp. OOF1S-7 TaxID=2917757 RepID=UPI001EF7046A|nr:hypothetical protein [Pseudoalteromonas sp. OOF1S-7]MCG7534146.1 hypothetical protein [Pseudoalteromonas sp. OOF1S-7]
MYQYLAKTTGKEITKPRQIIGPRELTAQGGINGTCRHKRTVQRQQTILNAAKNLGSNIFRNKHIWGKRVLDMNAILSTIAKASTGDLSALKDLNEIQNRYTDAESQNLDNLTRANIVVPLIRNNMKDAVEDTVGGQAHRIVEYLKNIHKNI